MTAAAAVRKSKRHTWASSSSAKDMCCNLRHIPLHCTTIAPIVCVWIQMGFAQFPTCACPCRVCVLNLDNIDEKKTKCEIKMKTVLMLTYVGLVVAVYYSQFLDFSRMRWLSTVWLSTESLIFSNSFWLFYYFIYNFVNENDIYARTNDYMWVCVSLQHNFEILLICPRTADNRLFLPLDYHTRTSIHWDWPQIVFKTNKIENAAVEINLEEKKNDEKKKRVSTTAAKLNKWSNVDWLCWARSREKKKIASVTVCVQNVNGQPSNE